MKSLILFILFIIELIVGIIFYNYLHKKTHIRKKFILIDNLISVFISFLITYLIFINTGFKMSLFLFIVIFLTFALLLYFAITLLISIYRFWRAPKRKIVAKENEIVSPADGNVIYINKINENDKFISIKNGKISDITEITKTNLISKPCWQIGINMTPLDVHKNCSPIDGEIVLSKHIIGVFYSLKEFLSMTENERHTFVIKNNFISVGIVLIASKRVRRIDSYVKEGQFVKKGDWIGMIRFGSQVDIFLPINCNIKVKIGEQVYTRKTIIASF